MCLAVRLVAARLGWVVVGAGDPADLVWTDTSISCERLAALGPTQVGSRQGEPCSDWVGSHKYGLVAEVAGCGLGLLDACVLAVA